MIEIMNRRKFLTSAAAAPALAAAQSSDTFTPLFDGRTLVGWSIRQGPESAFYVRDGAIVVHQSTGFPAWLRSAKEYENFDFRGEFFVQGWIDSGIYFHAPEHGRNTWEGMQMKIFHQQDEKPMPNSMGSIFPLIAPLKVNVKSKGDWNEFRILVQDLNLESIPELRHRLRRGYLGLASLSYPIRFRNLRVQELPPKEKWQALYAPQTSTNGLSPRESRELNQ